MSEGGGDFCSMLFPPGAPASVLPTSSNAQLPRLSTEGFSRGTGKWLDLELLLALLEVQEVCLELLVAMRFLEGEATQNCPPCLEDQEATECNVVIETCRRLIQVRVLFCISFLATLCLYIAVSSNAIWEILVDWIILSTHPGIFYFGSWVKIQRGSGSEKEIHLIDEPTLR